MTNDQERSDTSQTSQTAWKQTEIDLKKFNGLFLRSISKKINRHIHQKFVPRHLNNTELPGPEWSLSESADLVASPISSLFENKIIPKAGALRNYLEQDADFKKQYMDLFQHDYSLLNLMESLRPEST